MKKILITISLFVLSMNSFSQTCEEREDKLLSALGGLSAGFMYNTYAAIGSICDGFASDTYSESSAIDMLSSQKKLMDNLLILLNDLADKNMLKDKSDQDFMTTTISIIKGLKNQAQYYQDYMKNKNDQKKEIYDNQRKDNWKRISKLMGLED